MPLDPVAFDEVGPSRTCTAAFRNEPFNENRHALLHCPAAFRPQVARLARDQEGVSAVEFAMLLPLMLTLYLGGVEVSQGISIDRKVTLTARTVADLVAQVSSIDTTGVKPRSAPRPR